ncbi:hypothetical protein NMYAN_10281 [Nitrosomonas nitrosa]|uniref:Uncharacterized protein n=1 Tax=Nitrosomonas nitrosa TaxID=52442 RepID=A0A8H8YW83_9PROT|nr:hypothetical protein NMYAN_10281 [Nitrosomonas nitrosa]
MNIWFKKAYLVCYLWFAKLIELVDGSNFGKLANSIRICRYRYIQSIRSESS